MALGLLFKQFWPYIAGIAVCVAVVAYVQNHGKTVAKNETLKSEVATAQNQVKIEREAVAEVAKVKEIQKQQVSSARKEVNDAYSRGDVPQRVRKFYID